MQGEMSRAISAIRPLRGEGGRGEATSFPAQACMMASRLIIHFQPQSFSNDAINGGTTF